MRKLTSFGNSVFSLVTWAAFFAAGTATAQPRTTTLTTLHKFDVTDGDGPRGKLTVADGMFYGTTYQGGGIASNWCNSSCGVIFKINPKTGAEQVVWSFAGNFNGAADGGNPASALLYSNGILYGTTTQGGSAANAGTVFKFDLATGKETVLYRFLGGTDGFSPWSSLTIAKGALYGTTVQGGSANMGTVFKIDLATGAESIAYSFTGNPDGAQPYSPVAYRAGNLYGVTELGGASNLGTVFRIDATIGTETVLHSFVGGNDGQYPFSGLVYETGFFYGTTMSGGSTSNSGCIYNVNPKTGSTAVVYGFKGGAGDGAAPEESLLFVNGTLYGATTRGGPQNDGTLYTFSPAGQTENVLHMFSGSDGAEPVGGLVMHNNTFFGTTYAGFGTVYKLVP